MTQTALVTDMSSELPSELTSFVGRRGELSELRRLLSQSRLVTLTGSGGIGKTRLALRLAAELRRAHADGVRFVPLGDLVDGVHLAEHVAETLHLRSQSQRSSRELLVEFLRSRDSLLVLDNCEHLIDPCAGLVNELMRRCPRLHILTTSREPLRLDGETIHAVPSLKVPDRIDDSTRLTEFEAVRLFVDRARSVVPDFDITHSREAIVEICRQLEGIPLALELAAVRLRAMSPDDLLERLIEQWQLLDMGSRGAPARQRTMEACINWSYQLCNAEERDLWARLAVFSGGFELDAAEVVCGRQPPRMSRLQVTRNVLSLVEKAILTRSDEEDHVRYRMLETVRQHGESRLRELGQLDTMRRHHLDWCADLVSRAEAEWLSSNQIAWMRRLRREQSNLQAALDFCSAHFGEGAAGLNIAATLQHYAVAYGLFAQGRYWFDRLLPMSTEPSLVRLRALRTASWLAAIDGDLDATSALLDEGRAIAHGIGEPATSLITQASGLHAMFSGDLESAVTLYKQALAGFRSSSDETEEAHTLVLLGLTYTLLGDTKRAFSSHRHCMALTAPAGEAWFRSNSLWHAGLSAWRAGDYAEGVKLERESLTLKRLMDEQLGIALCFEALACIWAEEDPLRAAGLLGAASTLWNAMDTSTRTLPGLHALHVDCVDRVRRRLGEDTYNAEFVRWALRDRASAISFALDEPPPESREARAGQGMDVLTKRQREIAILVAQGLSNKEIADRLVISTRTVETHVENILTKLGFTSRIHIAAWILEDPAGDSTQETSR